MRSRQTIFALSPVTQRKTGSDEQNRCTSLDRNDGLHSNKHPAVPAWDEKVRISTEGAWAALEFCWTQPSWAPCKHPAFNICATPEVLDRE